MIPRTDASIKPVITENGSWQQELASSFTRIQDFLRYVDLAKLYDESLEQACGQFPFRVSRHFASLIRKGDPADPLLLQVLPSVAELQTHPDFRLDPLQDQQAHQGSGILQKYHGRALLISTAACAINCRYCFRRHFPYASHQAGRNQWSPTIARLRTSPHITEIILSGGDPLSLSNAKLADLLTQLQTIPHIKRLRIHTRLPVVLPNRIDTELLRVLGSVKLPQVMVIHVNHANELSPELHQALQDLRAAGITLLNQSVLLRSVNDNVEQQVELCENLFSNGVLPYYLHLLDKVAGTTHFEVSEHYARELHQAMMARLPGYLLPRLVVELPGKLSKLQL
jgi:EF-P beta-lysylation protein EpmB